MSTIVWADVGRRLREARLKAGFHRQEDVAILLGVSRELISYWETGQRRPGAAHLQKLCRLYGRSLDEILTGDGAPGQEPVDLLFRDAGEDISPLARAGVREFTSFLDDYADLLEALGETPPGEQTSPYTLVEDYMTSNDVRRKAEEVRAHYRLGLGPIPNLFALLDDVGFTIYRAPLGPLEDGGISGAFLNHRRMGFCILVNLDTTLGRQWFTLAHELAHALFHSRERTAVVSRIDRVDERERFANRFAGEFLVPAEALRAVMERLRVPLPIRDPEWVIRLQRHFHVSYAMMIVRLNQIGAVRKGDYDVLRSIDPADWAARSGVEPIPEWGKPRDRGRLVRYPRRFLDKVREAFRRNLLSPSSVADLLGVGLDEALEALAAPRVADQERLRELEELERGLVR